MGPFIAMYHLQGLGLRFR